MCVGRVDGDFRYRLNLRMKWITKKMNKNSSRKQRLRIVKISYNKNETEDKNDDLSFYPRKKNYKQ